MARGRWIVAQAHLLNRHLLATGDTVEAVGSAFGYSLTHASRILGLARLGPPVLRAVFDGTAPPRTTVKDLFAAACSLDWTRQAAHLGVPVFRAVDERGPRARPTRS